ncbi:MAG: hypothetical protein ACOYYS_21815 [Chloroflexota bacterium]
MIETVLPDILAVYGEALYLAQRMEIGMRIFYCLDRDLPKTPPGGRPRVDFDAGPLPDATQNSLGGLLRQFKREMFDEGAVDPQTRNAMRRLENSADYRNWLVHTSWWDWNPQLGSPAGRARVLAELIDLRDRFREHDQAIRYMVVMCVEHYGFRPEQFDSENFQAYMHPL